MRIGFWISAALAAGATTAFGAGYERTVLWSGKQVGVAGSGAATVNSSEALYFNPAGLAGMDKLEASVNFSPSWLQSKGPVNLPNQTLTSDNSFVPVGAVTAGYKLLDNLGIGAGVYVGGGARAKFTGLDFSSINPAFTYRPDVSSSVTMLEYALGVGYQILPGLKVGASWRIMHVSGTVESVVPTVNGSGTVLAINSIRLTNLSDTRYNGFRLGGQYDGDGWGVGLVVRTAVSFKLTGDLNGTTQTATGTRVEANATTGTIANAFPVSGTLGGYADFMDKTLRVIGEYQYANYAQNVQLDLTGTLTSALGSRDLATTPITQHWKDLHSGRVGFEYRGLKSTVLRAGYAIASDTTPKGWARATFSSPGLGHSVTLGAGRTLLGDKLDIDAAIDYSFAGGSVAAADITTAGTAAGIQPGDYNSRAYGLHLGATYRF